MERSYSHGVKALAVTAAAVCILSKLLAKKHINSGQVAIITGASRGLGLALAHRFGRAGVRLVLAARDSAELERALDELVAHSSISSRSDVVLHACDLRDPEQAKSLIDSAVEKFGQLDILINNAGIILVGPAENQTLAAYRDAMDTNFFAPLYCTYAAMPELLRQKSGAIVNISSVGGKIPVPHLLPYVAAKFALTGFSETLHAELRSKGICVTTVCPGLMRTGGEVHAEFRGQVAKEKLWFQLSARTPVIAAHVKSAADKIFRAVDEGRAEITITPQAWLAARIAGLAPETTQLLASVANRCLLPEPANGVGL